MSVVYQIAGFLLILFGLPLFWTPIPIGLIMIASGVALIISNSDWARERVRTMRRFNPGFDRWVCKAEGVVPHPFDRVLKSTEAREDGCADGDRGERSDR